MKSYVASAAASPRTLSLGLVTLLGGVLFGADVTFAAADAAAAAPEVEIKKHSTGKEATLRLGEKEWFIHVDVDQDRTMIIRTESDKGQEKSNQAEIIERPMSNTEVDHVVNDFLSGIKSTLKP
jgi:hypothetical protein